MPYFHTLGGNGEQLSQRSEDYDLWYYAHIKAPAPLTKILFCLIIKIYTSRDTVVVAEPDMQSVRIKEEFNSDGEDNEQQASTRSILKKVKLKSVKKEIAFSGLPKKLQIQPLPRALKEEVTDGPLLDQVITKPPPKDFNLRM